MSRSIVRHMIVIKSPQGLHARPAEMFARTAAEFSATIEVIKGEQRVDAKSILHLLTLGATEGTELVIEACGDDAQAAAEALVNLAEHELANEVSNENK